MLSVFFTDDVVFHFSLKRKKKRYFVNILFARFFLIYCRAPARERMILHRGLMFVGRLIMVSYAGRSFVDGRISIDKGSVVIYRLGRAGMENFIMTRIHVDYIKVINYICK